MEKTIAAGKIRFTICSKSATTGVTYKQQITAVDLAKIYKVEQYKEMRKEKKLSQEQVAAAAGMARPDISRFESGRYNPSLELMVRYAHALGCELKIELVQFE